mgnify:CR=1 FL=1
MTTLLLPLGHISFMSVLESVLTALINPSDLALSAGPAPFMSPPRVLGVRPSHAMASRGSFGVGRLHHIGFIRAFHARRFRRNPP